MWPRWASTRSGCRRSSPRRCRHGLRRVGLLRVDPLFGTLEDFDQLLDTAHGLGLKVIIDQVLSHTSDRHPVVHRKPRLARQRPGPTGTSGPTPSPTARRPTTGPPSSAAAWEWEPRRRQYYLHNFLIEQPDLNFHNPEVQDALLDTMRFWLDRGVDGFRLDTVNYYTHDAELRPNPPARNAWPDDYPVNPYDMQRHIHSKTRPENLPFVERMRALTDRVRRRG
jgi:alpha-glucosidase